MLAARRRSGVPGILVRLVKPVCCRGIGDVDGLDTEIGVHVDLRGHRALVTGGASGIGRAIAARLARAGASVLVADRNVPEVEKVASNIGGTPVVWDLAATDVPPAGPSDWNQVDILVNSAGFQKVAPIEAYPLDVYDTMMKVMVRAPFMLVRAVIPCMYQRGWGRIINVSSVHGHVASPGKAPYVMAKHALEGMSKVTALEGGPHGVTSVCIAPGYVRTPLVDGQIADQAALHGIAPEQVISDVLLAPAAVKKLIDPEVIAEWTAMLCTPYAVMMTGTSLVIDGAWTAR